jgi:DNA modification methylase
MSRLAQVGHLMSDPGYQIIASDASSMDVLRDGEAELILTSPPYYPEHLEPRLRQPRGEQIGFHEIRAEILEFARSLQACFTEVRRVSRTGGAVIVHTKDLRYGDGLIPLSAAHREILELLDYRLVTRVLWQKPFSRGRPADAFHREPAVGQYRAPDAEEFLVFALEGKIDTPPGALDLSAEEIEQVQSAVWRLPPMTRGRTHPHQSPPAVLRRLIALFSNRGDLVVDPFAGHGTVLRVAVDMGRRAIGYEIDPDCIPATDQAILRSHRPK